MTNSLLQQMRLPGDRPCLAEPLVARLWRVLLSTNIILLFETIHDARLEYPSLPLGAFSSLFLRSFLFLCVLGASFFLRRNSILPAISGCLLIYELCMLIPSGPNHGFLGVLAGLICSMALFLTPQPREPNLQEGKQSVEGFTSYTWSAIFAIRWLVVYVMLWSGLNKLIYGTYFKGEFFASAIHREPRFAEFFKWILPAAEVEEIINSESGPYRFTSLLPMLGANAVYLSEILAGVLLVFRRTAVYGVVLTFAILVGIEVAAVELVFGGLMVNLLLVYFPAWYVKGGYWVSVLINGLLLLYLIGGVGGWLPDLGIK